MAPTHKHLVKDLGIRDREDRPLAHASWDELTDQMWAQDPLVALVAVAELVDRIRETELHLVRKAKRRGDSWDALAVAMGKGSRQQTWRKYALHLDGPDGMPPVAPPQMIDVVLPTDDPLSALSPLDDEGEHRHGYNEVGDY